MPTAILARHLFACLFLLPLQGLAQFTIRGQVVDARGDLPLVGAHVRVDGVYGGAYTDANGWFVLHSSDRTALVRVSYIGFEDLLKRVAATGPAAPRTVLRLKPKAMELPMAEVLAPGPERVYERKDLHVGQYLVTREGIWVLVYDRERLWHADYEAGWQELRGARLHLLDTDFRERASITLPGDAHAMHRDFSGRAIVEGRFEAWLAEEGEEDIQLASMPVNTLYEAVLPWSDSIGGQLIGNNLDKTFPAFDYFARDLRTGADSIFCAIVDQFTLSLFRSQYKYMPDSDKVIAMDLALETGIDAEIIAGYMTGFPNDLYFHVPYAPLFVMNDTLCVFDHYFERIRRFDRHLQLIDEVPIVYHRDPDWEGELLNDRLSNAVYARFSNGPVTILQPVDPRTGALGAITLLTHPYPDEVQVSDGYAYYVYRPYGSLQKRTLYREALR